MHAPDEKMSDTDDGENVVARLRERVSQLEEEIDTFAYVLSHDLQAPVRTLQSFSQILRGDYADKLDEDGQQYLDFMADAGTQIQTLLTGLLNYSRARRVGDFSPGVQMDQLWLAVCAEVLPPDVQATLSGDFAPVTGNRDALRNVLKHLVTNALQAVTAPTPLQLTLRGELLNNAQQLWIEDNGRGIPDHLHAGALEVFRRVHPEPTGRAGMGLAVAREIVARHGGQLTLKSKTDPGLSVHISLPLGG